MADVALIINPIKVDDRAGLIEAVTARCRERGWQEPLVLETTEADPGAGMVSDALAAGAHRILVLGGDGTVAACGSALAFRHTPAVPATAGAPADGDRSDRGPGEHPAVLALLPGGTGNLLARNLDLPVEVTDALDVAFADTTRVLDVLAAGDRGFLVMAGVGFDATMMAETPEALKDRIGWPAYLRGLLRAVADASPVPIEVSVDGGAPITHRGIGVLVGNVGTLQGGIELLPEARPDDGELDVLVLAPRRLTGWIVLSWHLLRRRAAGSPHAAIARGRTVRISTRRPIAVEFDGDVAEPVDELEIRVLPAALRVCVR